MLVLVALVAVVLTWIPTVEDYSISWILQFTKWMALITYLYKRKESEKIAEISFVSSCVDISGSGFFLKKK